MVKDRKIYFIREEKGRLQSGGQYLISQFPKQRNQKKNNEMETPRYSRKQSHMEKSHKPHQFDAATSLNPCYFYLCNTLLSLSRVLMWTSVAG